MNSDEPQNRELGGIAMCEGSVDPVEAEANLSTWNSKPSEGSEQCSRSPSIELSVEPTNKMKTTVKMTPMFDSAPIELTQRGIITEKAGTEESGCDLMRNDSMQTPPVANCRSCEFLGLENTISMVSVPGLKQHNGQQECSSDVVLKPTESSFMAIGLRHVTSRPSLADAWGPDDLDMRRPFSLSRAADTRQSIMNVLERLSPKSNLRSDRNILFSSKANHDYLNNYLYFSKPSNEIANELDPPARPFCADPCGTKCGDTDGGCYLLSSAADTATFLFRPRSPRKDRDFTFETTSSKDYSEFHKGQETWFDAASEKFDGALERLVGSAPSVKHQWRKLFEAPTLNIKTPQSAYKVKADTKGTNDPKRIKGIVLVPQYCVRSRVVDLDTTADEAFLSLYGISRSEFRVLTKEERFALWEERQAQDVRQESANMASTGSPIRQNQRGRPQHRPAFSSTDLSLTP